MSKCEVCGNEYDKAFEVSMGNSSHTFDCFECAISALAPECTECGVKIVGHGVEAEDDIFCSAHCAGQKGHEELTDRA